MRKGTKSFVSILSLGLIAAGYQAGQAAEVSTGFSAAAAPLAGGTNSQAAATPTATQTPTPTATASASAAAAAPKATTAAKATTSTQAAPAAASPAAPAPVSTPAASAAAPAAPAATGTTKTGSAINYRYGTVQVSVTKANGKITAVNLLQAGATGGRQGAFSYLVQYAIQANGTSFGNLGGATFTTDAFKQSLESALAKF